MSNNVFSILGKMFYEPAAGFAALKDKTRAWFPFFLLLILSVSVMAWYFQVLDFPWMIERLIAAQADPKPEVREAFGKLSKEVFEGGIIAGMLFMMIGLYLLSALYFFIVSKATDSEISYGKWFGLVAWSNVPGLLALPLMALQIVSGHGRTGLEDLNMLTLNYLLFQFPMEHPWASLLGSISLPTFWALYLNFVGWRVWTQRSVGSCAVIVGAPYLVVFGLWAAKLVFFA